MNFIIILDMRRNVIKATYKDVEIKAINLYVTNNTMVSIGKGKERKQTFVNGCRAEELYNINFQKEAYNLLTEKRLG